MARPLAAAVGVFVVLGVLEYARADTAISDVARSPAPAESTSKFAGSSVEGSTYIGSGSFYVSGYRNPYASLALYVRPSYDLGTRFKLALRARIYVEEEFTQPDTANGRRFYPYDPWVWLAADNLHTFERSKIRIAGLFRTVWPLSYESRYQHLVVGVGTGLNANRDFEFGQVSDEARKWTLKLTYGLIFYKFLQTSNFRGSGPGDTTGCLAPPSSGGQGGGNSGPSASDADRCGGAANANVLLADFFAAALARGKWALAATLMVQNSFAYAYPSDALMPANAVALGRSDSTWGIISLAYQMRPHMALSAGISSLQPALDSRYRYLRFPFFDLSGGASTNNYTQLFLSVNGSL